MTDSHAAHSPRWPGVGLTERPVDLSDARRLRAVTAGTGDGPLVVFEAGLGAPAAEWIAVQRAVSTHTRTLSYDRAGYGGSDIDTHDRTLERMADDLTGLLDALDERQPIVLVGHSWGGPIVRVFADREPRRVAGIVFVDASLSMAFTPRSSSLLKFSLRLTSFLLRIGAIGLVKRLALSHGHAPELSEDDMDVLWRDYLSIPAMRAGMGEAAQVSPALGRMRGLEEMGLPDVPVVALLGGRREKSASVQRFRTAFTAAAQALSDAHPQGRFVVVADAGHLIPQEKPDAVVEAILDVIARAE
ncbi:alpha/beta fold hydrolase [Microbacterium sp. PMB16]|uniref:alpha/beta fold hydrolase n=1 Tax=Microbacterium sp. PMB16 TaxID=3120157 RepID=UPI003F4CA597